MITIALCNHKGGTGKTTTAVHLAAAFGLSGRRTLVIDLDPQGFLSRALGADEPAPEDSALALFDHARPLSAVPVQPMSGFDLLPSSMQLTRAMRRLDKPSDVLWAKDAIRTLDAYDVVLFDTAAAVTVYSLNALVAAQHAVIPVTPEQQPVVGAEQTFQTVRQVQAKLNPDLADPLFLLTQVDARRSDHTAYRAMLLDVYGPLMMTAAIRTSASLSRRDAPGGTAFDSDPGGRGARDYANAADELLTIALGGGRHTPVRGRNAALHGTLVRARAVPAPTAAAPFTPTAPVVPAFAPLAEAPSADVMADVPTGRMNGGPNGDSNGTPFAPAPDAAVSPAEAFGAAILPGDSSPADARVEVAGV